MTLMKEHTVFDENGETVVVQEPFYDARHRVWLGERPPRRSPDNPPCSICDSDEPSQIHMYPHLDSSNLFHYTLYHCRVCGGEFRV